jgi:hypothetical protein
MAAVAAIGILPALYNLSPHSGYIYAIDIEILLITALLGKNRSY